ncbi:unnamed protein product [Symbiodinium sp. CCMP2592]|nr:unnamed protein product [Symbiodinium sp. CCMP2592]
MNKLASFCEDAQKDELHHVSGKEHHNLCKRLRTMAAENRQHYLFLWAAHANCKTCSKAWLSRGADLDRGSGGADACGQWNALRWAEEAQAVDTIALLREATRARSASDGSTSARPGLGNQSGDVKTSQSSAPVLFAGAFMQAGVQPGSGGQCAGGAKSSQPDEAVPFVAVCEEADQPSLKASRVSEAWESEESYSPVVMNCIEDFFQASDGCAAQVFAAALGGNQEKLQNLLRQFPVLQARPRVRLARLPGVMEFWTLREYVFLARLRAYDAGCEERVEALSGVLILLDKAEKEEAETLAAEWRQKRMNVAESRLFQQTIQGRVLVSFQPKCSASQLKVFNAILHRIAPSQLQDLLQEEPEESTPLKTREDLGLCCHPRSRHWPLRTYVLAKIALEHIAENIENLHAALKMLRTWETDLVEAAHAHFLQSSAAVHSLKMLFCKNKADIARSRAATRRGTRIGKPV